MKIAFMGTPEFASVSLEKIISSKKHEVVAVYTQPDRASGRGNKTTPSSVKQIALKHDIAVYQPKTMRDDDVIREFEALDIDIAVVVAFGQILPEGVLNAPKFGCINIHGSLLPLYRGAAPIQWALINGERKTGVTSMHISKGLDEGDIILQREMPLDGDINVTLLFDEMALVGADVVLETLDLIEGGNAKRITQESTGVVPTFAPMLKKEIGLIDFTKTAEEIHNLIRGIAVWPVASTIVNDINMKVFKSRVVSFEANLEKSEGELVDSRNFIVKCGDNTFLELLEVQLAGKKRVSGKDFMNGSHLTIGDVLG